jgi:hypothetical protein
MHCMMLAQHWGLQAWAVALHTQQHTHVRRAHSDTFQHVDKDSGISSNG